MAETMTPRLLVFSSLFPSQVQPHAGVFIRERMFRVGKVLPLVVVAPVAWFPLQGMIRWIKPGYRPLPPKQEIQDGVVVYHPRFFSVPGLFRSWDGLMMALGAWRTVRRLRREFGFDMIDAHFAYPDGYAATWLGQRMKLPVTITLRGTEIRHAQQPALRQRLCAALQRAAKILTVSDSLRQHALALGIPVEKTQVVGNGVDLERFYPENKSDARRKLGVHEDAPVLISVGGLVERKGFHRVIDCLPALRARYPDIQYLIVGGPSPEGDMREALQSQVERLGLSAQVKFLGPMPSSELRWPLSAADCFVLATRNEGWANVFLEAMACGLPVVTTAVGGNQEVVCRDDLGSIVPYDQPDKLEQAIADALARQWNREAIRRYAEENDWDRRVILLAQIFSELHATWHPHSLSQHPNPGRALP